MLVALSQIESGAVARSAILDGRDQVLAPAGTVLSDGMIQTLKARNVSLVDIVSIEDPAALADARSKEQARLAELFGISPKTPELFQLQRILMEGLNG
jgi:hypothetical protein